MPFGGGCRLIGIGRAGTGRKWRDDSSPIDGGVTLTELSGLAI